jgi:serine/threonine protein kinase/formylglycine-generating enzyme required for sulfatase activity
MPNSHPERLLLEYLDLRERDPSLSFDAFCARHPAHADDLRKMFAGWQLAQQAPDAKGSFAARLKERFGSHADPQVSLDPGADAPVDPTLLDALKSRGPASSRYHLKGQVAKGGMGVILRVWDEDLRRHLAMKVMLSDADGSDARLSRFLEEAQVTGQLDHPGIVPVHELGIDARGRVFFTMKLVHGRTLTQVFDAVKRGADGWNVTRALSVVLRVCEAMAFAHEKGVIHRDLKPANIMVGRFGETYVMDWGLARVLSARDTKDIRPRHDEPTSVVRTDRRDASSATPNSSLLTMDGDQLGTPAYMSPEQARGDLARIGPHSDVYAVGAILYQLLSGRMPYVEPDESLTPWDIVQCVISGPPRPLDRITDDVPAELLAICARAMEREPSMRYASMLAFADDLRAYLERRVVRAYETGAFAELKKWVQRNKGLAAVAAVLLMVLVGATALVLRKNREVEAKNVEVSARKAEFDQLAGVVLLENARKSESALHPAHPDRIEPMKRWLATDAARLLAMKPALTATIAELEERAQPRTELDAEIARLEAEIAGGPALAFADESQAFLHATLTSLRTQLDAFESELVARVRQRLTWAERIEALTLRHPRAKVTWDDARAALAKADGVVASPLYRDVPIDLKPQIGLVPLGMNPVTQLWEFYELRSACDVKAGQDPSTIEIPSIRADGSIDVRADTGIVFVLLPGATFTRGAQKKDENAPNFDPSAEVDEGPQSVTLEPYFIARHELTRGQWARLTDGGEPSAAPFGITYDGPGRAIGWSHPVENVSWVECDALLPRLGMRLPTEAQWEYATRAGTRTPWWTGFDASSLKGAANVLDVRGANAQPAWGQQHGDFDDGFIALAPAGSFQANAFGLFDTHGNLGEWCADAYSGLLVEPRVGDGLRQPTTPDSIFRVYRGGTFSNSALQARSAYRVNVPPEFKGGGVGVRVARDVR